MIHRPAVGSSLGPKAAPSLLSIGESSKHMIQIIQLLEERSMSFSFCLNKTDVLVLCAMTQLYQTLDLKHDSKLTKDAERLVNSVLKVLLKSKAAGTYDLKRVASMLISVEEPPTAPAARASPETSMAAPPSKSSPQVTISKKKPMYALGRHMSASMSETDLLLQQEKLRRMTMPTSSAVRPDFYRSQSRSSFDDSMQFPTMPRHDQGFSISQIQQSMMRMSPTRKVKPNLDYLSLGTTPSTSQPTSPVQTRVPPSQVAAQHHQRPQPLYPTNQVAQKGGSGVGMSVTEWETLLGTLDGGQMNVYDAIYGGPGVSLENPNTVTANYGDWSPDSWDLTSFNIGDLTSNPAAPQSVLSLSDDSLSSGDDLATSDLYLSMGNDEFRNNLLHPTRSAHDAGLILDGVDLNLGL